LIAAFAEKSHGSNRLAIGGQDCHPNPSGAHTGDISAEMLADAGASAVIVGHSERRADHGESDGLVRQKAEAAWRAVSRPSSVSAENPTTSRFPGKRLRFAAGSLRARCPIAGAR